MRAVGFALALVTVTLSAEASPNERIPAGTDPVPLLVLLHGDWGHPPAEQVTHWERHVAGKNVAVLALKCPADLGCKGSWWQWDGDPAWITAQIDAFAKTRPIDRKRLWLVGWSGGASYMGLRAQDLQKTFAALVYHGGGIPPHASDCPSAAAPTYFLVGTGNPLHHLAIRLRQHHEACKETVVWDAIAGADHGAEWTALDTHGGALMKWLSAQQK